MKNKKEIIVATHGKLAEGFKSAIDLIVGKAPNVHIMSCYLDSEFNLTKEIKQIMEEINFDDTSVIVCTDLLGGSVNNEFVKVMKDYPFHLITNINLALLIDLILTEESVNKESIEEKIVADTFSLKYVNNYISQIDEMDSL